MDLDCGPVEGLYKCLLEAYGIIPNLYWGNKNYNGRSVRLFVK